MRLALRPPLEGPCAAQSRAPQGTCVADAWLALRRTPSTGSSRLWAICFTSVEPATRQSKTCDEDGGAAMIDATSSGDGTTSRPDDGAVASDGDGTPPDVTSDGSADVLNEASPDVPSRFGAIRPDRTSGRYGIKLRFVQDETDKLIVPPHRTPATC